MIKLFFYSLLGMLFYGQIATADCIDWKGLYIGGQVGGGWSSAHWKYVNANPYDANGPGLPILGSVNKFRSSNIIGGGQVGFNFQLSRFIVSLEAACVSGGYSEKKFNVVQIFPLSNQTVKTDITVFALATGRIGYLVYPAWLVYAKGGCAGATVKTRGQISPSIIDLTLDWSTSKWHNGWVVGAGLEYKFHTRITIGLEYNYISLNKLMHIGPVSGGLIGPEDQIKHKVDANVQTIVARLNFLLW